MHHYYNKRAGPDRDYVLGEDEKLNGLKLDDDDDDDSDQMMMIIMTKKGERTRMWKSNAKMKMMTLEMKMGTKNIQ